MNAIFSISWHHHFQIFEVFLFCFFFHVAVRSGSVDSGEAIIMKLFHVDYQEIVSLNYTKIVSPQLSGNCLSRGC